MNPMTVITVEKNIERPVMRVRSSSVVAIYYLQELFSSAMVRDNRLF